jgi:hypothetical protein
MNENFSSPIGDSKSDSTHTENQQQRNSINNNKIIKNHKDKYQKQKALD